MEPNPSKQHSQNEMLLLTKGESFIISKASINEPNNCGTVPATNVIITDTITAIAGMTLHLLLETNFE